MVVPNKSSGNGKNSRLFSENILVLMSRDIKKYCLKKRKNSNIN
jgi:hypothetical protein